MKRTISLMMAGLLAMMPFSYAMDVEIQDPTRTQVVMRENPKTGTTFVSIVSLDQPEPQPLFQGDLKKSKRPDYRMLDAKVKPKDVGYEGPSSDRTKVYVFAATLAASGVAAGTLIPVTAATGAGAAGSGFGYAAAGAGVAAATVGGSLAASRTPPEKDTYTHKTSVKFIRPLPLKKTGVSS